MTDYNLDFVFAFPAECCQGVTRDGEHQPCDKTAVALAVHPSEPEHAYPVCVHHTRIATALPLSEWVGGDA